ncbi:hypothetical protein FPZ42_06875 [Mucilaginibacter achroorhodeus]|uniref:Uncharacterized protein n=1 Tax=Mucilaginibacter achroorhodeus TaxID=2599294 RepID=A0A563U611_9SPHI|nr:hypothetical protein [Mucilaginibacter achroorhodeus]TWR26754.1 hypothetical protein FPZ42_06875 [Mucilaginibacter achroorhodeus]
MKNKLSRKRFAFIALLAIAFCSFISCKKSSGDANGGQEIYMSCKINGTLHEFNYHVNANDKPATDTVHFVVIGGWEKPDMVTGFGIDMQIDKGAKEGSYVSNSAARLLLSGKYYIQQMKDGKILGTTIYNGGDVDGSNFTMTITSLTKWGVKGTFSGKLRLLTGDEYLTVTDGKFSAPYN